MPRKKSLVTCIKYIELSKTKSTTSTKLWGAEKAVLKGKSMALNMYDRKEEKS